MKKAIYLRLVLLTAVSVLICSLISVFAFAEQTQKETKVWLTRVTLAVSYHYAEGVTADELSGSIGGIRVTVIAPDGTVLSDSAANAKEMENHAERAEIKSAARNRVYLDVHKSSTLGTSFMYSSIRMEDDTVLRLAYQYSGLWSNITPEFPAMIAAIVISLLLAMLLSGWLLRAATDPLKKIQTALSQDNPEALKEYHSDDYEIYQLTQSIRLLWQQIADANQSLMAERERVDYLLSNMPEGFLLIDGEKRILLCNASAKQFFDCAQKIESQNILALTRDTNINRAIDEALSQDQVTLLEMSPKDGLVLRVSVSPVKAGKLSKNEPGATVMMTNITDTRRLERQKQDFFSNASHELKTPITSILGFAEMLAEGVVENEDKEKSAAKTIEKEARRMSGLISDLLMISDLESGTAVQDPEYFHFDDVIREVAESLAPLGKSMEVRVNLDLDSVPVCAGKNRINALCMNLMNNAVKYNKPDGTVFVTLKTDGKNAVFSVRDTGVGIAKEHQQRVFERFFRVDSGRDKRVGGTGLGLSIVKHVVSQYDGEITMQSEEGKGTTITASLPILIC